MDSSLAWQLISFAVMCVLIGAVALTVVIAMLVR
jgi:hypothetical protein